MIEKIFLGVAGILALAATQQYFLLNEVASRILPALCPLTADPEKSVREPAFKTIRGFLGKLERVSEDPTLRESMGKQYNALQNELWIQSVAFQRLMCTLLLRQLGMQPPPGQAGRFQRFLPSSTDHRVTLLARYDRL